MDELRTHIECNGTGPGCTRRSPAPRVMTFAGNSVMNRNLNRAIPGNSARRGSTSIVLPLLESGFTGRRSVGLLFNCATATTATGHRCAVVAGAFGLHVMGGGAYEMSTVGALALRFGFWALVAVVAWRALKPKH